MENVSIQVTNDLAYPDLAALQISGFIHANTLPQLERTFQTTLNDKKKKILFDLSDTSYISSGGWGFFIACYQAAGERGAVIALTGMKPDVHDAFELLEYHKVIPFFPTTDEALRQGFGKNPAPVGSPDIALA